METDLILRPPGADDFDAWLPLWDAYNAFYGRHGDSALPPAISRLTWQRFLDPAEPVHALLAWQGTQLLGLAHYVFHRNTLMPHHACYLQDLFTVPEARGRGVARRLIAAVAGEARAAGSPSLYWHTRHDNSTARQLYDRVARDTGFVVYRQTF
ncbi:GNAT family N-acetyltransferase [Vogesella sp. LYT5W]|uniref:GNAT family N-acetyltransferase n=1 Tax=Vogesella margarita TaxID=2984199 RepID=A0ABT5IQR0_9NEIS|nr:GNAT family N-acetyltransferase [Vogesella margarita]MDC7714915.1 GNAT family N-acetyltransferase [Vogesella margarita]